MSRYLPILAPQQAKLPTVAALDALWREVSRRPLWAPPHFWRYVKLRRAMRLKLLDPSAVRIAAPPGKINDCSACYDICCVGPRATVLLRLRDIAALIDLDKTSLIAFDKPTFSPEDLVGRPALQRQVGSQAWRIFPALKQNSMHACVALTTQGKCSLYPHWPLACARFPYALHADDVEVFYSKRCDAFWLRKDTQANSKIDAMGHAAVAAYNERIKDAILLSYAENGLADLGLTRFLNT